MGLGGIFFFFAGLAKEQMQSWDFFLCVRAQGKTLAELWWCREGLRWV
jgi:hypothetical protein